MKTLSLAPWFLLVCSAPALAQEKAPLPDGEELFKRIVEHHRPMYEKYRGIEAKAETKSWIYDSETNELKETSEMITVGKQLFYEKPQEPKVLKYVKNGEELPPEEFKHRGGGEPMFPVFDPDGPEHYRIEVVDRAAMRRQPCYVLEVKAKEATAKHFVGTIYVNAETLDLVFMDGGMADTPFGVDSMTFQAYMKQVGDLSVWESSTFTAVVDIPILFPDMKMVSESKVLEAKGIPK